MTIWIALLLIGRIELLLVFSAGLFFGLSMAYWRTLKNSSVMQK